MTEVSGYIAKHFMAWWAIGLAVLIGMLIIAQIKRPVKIPTLSFGNILSLPKYQLILGSILLLLWMFTGWLFIYQEEFLWGDLPGLIAPVWEHGRPHRSYGIMPLQGRFFPLFLQEWKFILRLWPSIEFIQALAFIQLTLFLTFLYAFLKDALKMTFLGFLLFFLIVFSTVAITYNFYATYTPERYLLFFAAMFIVAAWKYHKNKHPAFGWLAIISVYFGIFYKEPSIFFFGGFALFYIIFTFIKNPFSSPKSFFKYYWVELTIGALCCLFILSYCIIVIPIKDPNMDYIKHISTNYSLLNYVKIYFSKNIYWTSLCSLFTIRTLYLIIRRRALHAFWDSLAIGGILYGASIMYLGVSANYYMSIPNLVAILYVYFIVFQWLHKQAIILKSFSMAILLYFLIQSFQILWADFAHRKEFNATRIELASFLKSYQKNNSIENLNMYVPATGWWRLYMNMIYFKHCGIKFNDMYTYIPKKPAIHTFTPKGPNGWSIWREEEKAYFDDAEDIYNYHFWGNVISRKKIEEKDLILFFDTNFSEVQECLKFFSNNPEYEVLFKSSDLSFWKHKLHSYVFKKIK